MHPTSCILILLLLCAARCFSDAKKRVRRHEEQRIKDAAVDRALNNEEDVRDKRALGIILQAFGYTPSFQIGSFPNPNVTTSNTDRTYVGLIGRIPTMPSARATPAPPTPPITYPPGSTIPLTVPPLPQLTYPPDIIPRPTKTPRRKETIRFTGVVNFGNNSDLLGHLQQYEQVFHGPANTTTAAPPYSPAPPRLPFFPHHHSHSDASKSPLLSPLLVRIPLPIAPDLPPALLPAPAPFKQHKEMEYRNEENSENYQVQSDELKDSGQVSREHEKSYHAYDKNPYWEKLYEDRIAELERQTEKLAEKLVQEDDRRRNYEKSSSSESNEGQYKPDDESKYYSGDYADSREQYNNESSEKGNANYFDSDKYKHYSEYDENSRENNESNDQSEYFYSKEKLPLNYNRERIKPSETLKNSYGEQLENKGVLDGRIADYYTMFRSRDGENGRGPWTHAGKLSKNNYKPAVDQNHDLPIQKSKYEEYELSNNDAPEYNKAAENDGKADFSKTNYAKADPNNRSLYIVHSTSSTHLPKLNINKNKNLGTPNYVSGRAKDKAAPVSNYAPHKLRSYPYIQESRNVIHGGPKKQTEVIKNVAGNAPTQSTLPYFDFIKYSPYTLPVQYVYKPDSYEKLREIANSNNYEPTQKPKLRQNNIESFESADFRGTEQYSYEQPLRGHVLRQQNKELRVSPPPFDNSYKHSRQNYRLVNSAPTVPPTYYPSNADGGEDSSVESTTKNVELKGYLLLHPSETSSGEKRESSEEVDNDASIIGQTNVQHQNAIAHSSKINKTPYYDDMNYGDFGKAYEYDHSTDHPFNDQYFTPSYSKYMDDGNSAYDYSESGTKSNFHYGIPKITRKMDVDVEEINSSEIDDDGAEQLMQNTKTNITNTKMFVTTYEISSSDMNPITNKTDKNEYKRFDYRMSEYLPSQTNESKIITQPDELETSKKLLNSQEFGIKLQSVAPRNITDSIERKIITIIDDNDFFPKSGEDSYKFNTSIQNISNIPEFNTGKDENKSQTVAFKISDKKINNNGRTKVVRYIRNIANFA